MNIYPIASSLRSRLPRWAYEALRRPANVLIGSLNQVLTTGHLRSAAFSSPVNSKGEPVPWLSYPAIRALDAMNLYGLKVLEFGSGNSTRYWLRRGAVVKSIESDPAWFDKVVELNGPNCEVTLEDAAKVKLPQKAFDIVLIDGPDGAKRLDSLRAVLEQEALHRNGILIIDNTDSPEYEPLVVEVSRYHRLMLRVDYYGFSPGNASTQCTSFYGDAQLSRMFYNKYATPYHKHWL